MMSTGRCRKTSGYIPEALTELDGLRVRRSFERSITSRLASTFCSQGHFCRAVESKREQ
jgi:hypothetical protein